MTRPELRIVLRVWVLLPAIPGLELLLPERVPIGPNGLALLRQPTLEQRLVVERLNRHAHGFPPAPWRMRPPPRDAGPRSAARRAAGAAATALHFPRCRRLGPVGPASPS